MATTPTTKTAAASLRALLDGLVDYAGLFPPAALDMKTAVGNYARYLLGEYRWALGRFIVPVARLEEFQKAQNALLNPALVKELLAIAVTTAIPETRWFIPPDLGEGQLEGSPISGTFPWKLSAIVGNESELGTIEAFNSEHGSRALIDAIEIKAASIDDVRKLRPLVPEGVTPYFEFPADSRPELFQMIAAVSARAKIRTGGVVESAFPQAVTIAQFMANCAAAKCAFKATAGLHHPVRCMKPLTYEANAPTGKMHGFLNVFVAAVLAREGLRSDSVEAVLLNEQPANFVFTDEKCEVRALHTVDKDGATHNTNFSINISTERIRAVRESFATSFGSCSFEEPIEDLRSLHLL